MPRTAAAIFFATLLTACATPAPPDPPELAHLPRLDLRDTPRLGDKSARIAVVVFSDYQCPFCARVDDELLPALVRGYVKDGVVQLLHKDFPLSSHPQAVPAALAARCAAAQGRFWQMHRKLFDHQDELDEKLYPALARELGLDAAQFDACRTAPEPRAAIARDARHGRALGVRATPTLMLGRVQGELLVVERLAAGVPGYEQLSQEIERLRAALKGRAPTTPAVKSEEQGN